VPEQAAADPSVLAVDVRRFPWIRRLAADYAYNFSSVAPFFSGNPVEPSAWSDAIARTQQHPRRRQEIAAVIAAQQRRRGTPQPAIEAAAALADSRTVAIVTGQQAGLFGGPLFTLLKAITALKLAERVTAAHQVPCVVIFWIDSEDHDWDEVRTCQVFDAAMTPRVISLPPRQAAAAQEPVASIRLDETVAGALHTLEEALPDTEFKTELLETLRAIYKPGVGMAEAFGIWLERTLGNRGLVVFDAADPAAKPLAGAVFERELTTAGETVRRAAQAGSDLVDRGYHAQVQPHDALALFHVEAGRQAIRQQNGQFVVGEQSFRPALLIEQSNDRPGTFSPNVLLRPIVQDTLFPTICYVAGPNELAYLGQLRTVYDHFGIPMPLMYPRASATILDSAALRFLGKYNLPLEALQQQDESALNALLAAQIPPAVDEALSAADRSVEESMTRVIEVMRTLDATLEGTAKTTRGRMQHDLQTLRAKTIQAAKRRDETLRRQYHRTRALAFPNGHPQEREIGFVSFLNQYGPALVERLHAQIPVDLGVHWVVVV
jgi:bacillithiol biosynthesis cysteine-adding enzyme BshC